MTDPSRIDHAMILAAGLGRRMRPLTERLPKPLVPVAGRTLIDWTLDRFVDAGLGSVVVNLHHHADQVAAHLARRGAPRIVLSREETLLETGGGVRHALLHLGDGPFYVANADVIWLDGHAPALRRMAAAWDGERMDVLLLMQSSVTAHGYDGIGDYFLEPGGRLRRRKDTEIAPFIHAGVQILHRGLFADAPEGAFSLNRIYDRAEEEGRLYGIRHDGEWYHVGTAEGLAEAERDLEGAEPLWERLRDDQ